MATSYAVTSTYGDVEVDLGSTESPAELGNLVAHILRTSLSVEQVVVKVTRS